MCIKTGNPICLFACLQFEINVYDARIEFQLYFENCLQTYKFFLVVNILLLQCDLSKIEFHYYPHILS